MAIPYLFGARIEAKARAKPKPNEGLGTCFSMFRIVKKNGYRRKSTEITLYTFTGPKKGPNNQIVCGFDIYVLNKWKKDLSWVKG